MFTDRMKLSAELKIFLGFWVGKEKELEWFGISRFF